MGVLSSIVDGVAGAGAYNSAKNAVDGFIKGTNNGAKAAFAGTEMRTILRVPPDYFSSGTEEGIAIKSANDAKFDALSKSIKDPNSKINFLDPALNMQQPPTGPTSVLQGFGGIIFPFTPTITVENKAEYASQAVMHSNYHQYFYKNSSAGPIKISGKFTVQDQSEGAILLGTIHLLRALTKMRFGDDPSAGAPPPVCRLDAYGTAMLKNIPVVVTGWSHELPDSVDYITVANQPQVGMSMVPVLSTISIDLNVVYSRQEMLNYNVPGWINNKFQGQGYL